MDNLEDTPNCDLRNLQLTARFDSPSGEGVTNAYDGFGRLASSSTLGGVTRTLTYAYDANGNRTRITHPDGNAFFTTYEGLGRPEYLDANATTGTAHAYYSRHGPLARINRSATVVVIDYDGVQRPTLRLHYFTPGAANVAWNYGFNPAGQIGSVSRRPPGLDRRRRRRGRLGRVDHTL